ncbi:hypothetical protein RAM58_05035 [Staphylococcus pseudintermedius]|uniref:hypothetical protein n=1 Tax=Staphylococcus pseudintermedius TaxID=283734 RepID=UPI0019EF8784|nr:hypothetical protein [Staphylococcus pseudintermedius]
MEKYNRDLYTKGLESYEVPQYEPGYKPLDFVFGFVAGAVLGSALGLILKPGSAQQRRKSSQQTVNAEPSSALKEEAIRKAEALKAQARRVREESKTSTGEATADELSAQQRAIRNEVDSDRLEGQTPREPSTSETTVATSTTEAVTATGLAQAANQRQSQKQQETEVSALSTPSTENSTVAAQQRAIQSEVDSDRLQDTSVRGKDANVKVNDKGESEAQSTQDSTVKAQQRAIRSEVDSDRLQDKGQSTNAQVNDQGKTVDAVKADPTAAVPKNSHSQATFENGVITHDRQGATTEKTTSQHGATKIANDQPTASKTKASASTSKSNSTSTAKKATSSKKTNGSKKVTEKAKKTNQKVEKHTFND